METDSRRPVLELDLPGWRGWMREQGQPAYRADQVLDWIVRRRATSFGGMTDVPKRLREELERDWTPFALGVAARDVAPDGTIKLVYVCQDGRRIESVLMAEGPRRTVCISTQVGCAMGCVFCASGLTGVERNLSVAELMEQVIQARNALPEGETITHIVVMGMGESLANLDNLIPALDRLCSNREGLGISQRRITISTVGLPRRMRELAELDRRYSLAVSLHAPTETLRDQLVPVNHRIGLGAVMEAADAYHARTGRQVTYEYVLLAGLNDRAEDARALAELLESRQAHVNLIPYNPVSGLPYGRPSASAVAQFRGILADRGISVTIRKTKGRAIDAACGQLRRRLAGEGQERLLSSEQVMIGSRTASGEPADES